MNLKSSSILEISQELSRFDFEMLGFFRCPTCLRDFPKKSKEITEELIVPDNVGGKISTFLCKDYNSLFGSK